MSGRRGVQEPVAGKPQPTEVLRFEGVAMRLGGRPVLEEVSFAVGRGEVVGLLGSNGAGKTTTIQLFLGFIEPTSGSATIKGPVSYTHLTLPTNREV